MPKIFVMGEDLNPIAKFGFDLTELEITIGKGEDNNIIIADDNSVSTEHCVIKRVLGGYIIKDLGSSNGIKHDGDSTEKAELTSSSVIMVGETELRFSLDKKQIKLLKKEPQKPQVYVTEDLLPEIRSLHAGKIDELWLDDDQLKENKEEKPNKKAKKTTRLATNSGPASTAASSGYRPPAARSRPTGSQVNAGNPMLSFLIVFVLACVGIFAGLYARHNQVHGSDLIQDVSSGKQKSIFITSE